MDVEFNEFLIVGAAEKHFLNAALQSDELAPSAGLKTGNESLLP